MASACCPETDVDLWDEAVLADPWPTYRALQALGPVVRLSRHGLLALTRYDGVRNALQDWEVFSSAQGVGVDPDLNASSGRGILSTDPPLHDTRRRVLNAQLVPRSLTAHEPLIDERAEELVAALVAAGSFDAVHDLARPYTLGIVADLVGLPQQDREHLIDRATCAFNTFGPRNELLESSMTGFRDLVAYAQRIAVPGSLEPGRWGEQIYDAAARGEVEAEACPGLMLAYVWAGMDTTVNAIASAVWLFAKHPDQWDLVRRDPAIIPSAFNEVLRIHPPVQRFTRVTTREVTVEGVEIPANQRVVVLFGAANRDERHFPDPERFDITRNPVDMLSFGRGIHHCVGASLARLESHAVLRSLAARVARFELLDAAWRANNALHGPAHCRVRTLPAVS
jgi:cytochrome P450